MDSNPNIAQILMNAAEALKDKPAIIHGKRQISYAELARQVALAGSHFAERGIVCGDRLLFFVPMSIDLYILLLGCWYCGAAAVFLDAWATRHRLGYACTLCRPKGFVGTWKSQILRLLCKETRAISRTWISGLHRFVPRDRTIRSCAQVEGGQTALITFTTGSTSEPKAADRTHDFLRCQQKVLSAHINSRPDDVDLATLPVFVLSNLAAGITTVLPDFNPAKPQSVDPARLARTLEHYKVTTSCGSPALYDSLARYCVSHQLRIPLLRRITTGGAPVFAAQAQLLTKAFPEGDISIVYGSTEAEPVSQISAPELIRRSASSERPGLPAGKPVTDCVVAIIEITEEALGPLSPEQFRALRVRYGSPGEICVSGPHVLKHYFNDPLAQKRNKIVVEETIWHRTGDAGYMDTSGHLYLMGRALNRIKWQDSWLYLFPYEEALSRIPEVSLGTLMVVQHRLTAIVEFKKGLQCCSHRIIEFVRNQGLIYPEKVIVTRMARDPRHHSKIDYAKVRHCFK